MEDPAKDIDSKFECRIVKEMGIDMDKKHGKHLLWSSERKCGSVWSRDYLEVGNVFSQCDFDWS